MKIDGASFEELESFGIGLFFKMVMEKLWHNLCTKKPVNIPLKIGFFWIVVMFQYVNENVFHGFRHLVI